MTVWGWVVFVLVSLFIAGFGFYLGFLDTGLAEKLFTTVIVVILIAGLLIGMLWLFNHTASGQRLLVDERSDLSGGLDRTVTVYTADGSVIAQYSGKIDLEEKDGGYVKFDFDGKRYIYYNCFVESVADIENGR